MPPGLVTIKTLFALSCNRCAFPGCDERLADPQWNGVRADIAHIRGERPGAARYAPEMSDADRNAVDNLMLLCPNHHREVDRLRPQDWPPNRLSEIKTAHEAECGRPHWASETDLEYYGSLLITAETESARAPSPELQTGKQAPTRLVMEKGEKEAWHVVNIGDNDAFNVTVTVAPGPEADNVLVDAAPIPRLSPGGRGTAVLYGATMGSRGTPAVIVKWYDTDGNAYDGEFPLA